MQGARGSIRRAGWRGLGLAVLVCLGAGPGLAQLKPVRMAGESVEPGPSSAPAALRGVQFLRGAGAVAVRLRTSGPVEGTLGTTSGPARVYVDLRGLALDAPPSEEYVGAGGVWHARWTQVNPQEQTARLVLDLSEALPARWVPAPDGGRLEVGTPSGDLSPFTPERPRVESVDLVNKPGESGQLIVRLSGPAEFWVEVSRHPYLFTLVLPDAVATPLCRTAEPEAEPTPLPPSLIGSGIGVPTPLPTSDARSVRLVGSGVFIRSAQVRPLGDCGVQVEVRPGWVMRPAVEADRTGREITLTLRRDTLAGKRLVIDPGHGGKDSGAKGCGLQEKDITLLVATDLITKLTEAGALAFLTRDRDVFIPLPERPRLATVLGADAFVSIHCNAGDRPNQGHGTEAYYYTPQSLLLADMLQDSLVAGLGRRDNGVRQRHFAVLWRSPTPSSLVELMYIDCTGEGQLLCRPAVQQAAAQALFEALRAYFEGVQLTPEGEWPAGSLTPCPLPWQGRG